MRNKKSQAEDLLQFVFVVLVLVVIVLIFSFKDMNRKKLTKEQLDFQTLSQDASELLAKYLRLQFNEVDDTNLADAIGLYFSTKDDNLLKKIYALTNEFFSRSVLETDLSSWSIEINYPGKSPVVIESQKSMSEYPIRVEISNIEIPAYNSQLIKIRLFQTKKDERI